MIIYPYMIVLHILSAAVWLAMIPANTVLRHFITSGGEGGKRKLVSAWLKILNISGMFGMTGILVSGIFLVLNNPVYGFFVPFSNHWLFSKQVIMVLLILMTGIKFIPLGKKIRVALGDNLESSEEFEQLTKANIERLAKNARLMGILVLVNFLFGILHQVGIFH